MAAPPLKKPQPRTSPRQPWRRATQPKRLRMWQAGKDVKWIIVNSEPGHLLWRAPYFMEQNRGGRRGLTFLDADKSAKRSRGRAICTLLHSWLNIVQGNFFLFLNSLLSKSARTARSQGKLGSFSHVTSHNFDIFPLQTVLPSSTLHYPFPPTGPRAV